MQDLEIASLYAILLISEMTRDQLEKTASFLNTSGHDILMFLSDALVQNRGFIELFTKHVFCDLKAAITFRSVEMPPKVMAHSTQTFPILNF